MNNSIQLSNIPLEIICLVLEQMSIEDLVRIERTSRHIQSLVLYEIEKRIQHWNEGSNKGDERLKWRMLVHLSEQEARPYKFDPITKQVTCEVAMDPVEIRLCWDHKRDVHCQLLQRQNDPSNTAVKNINDDFTFTLEPTTPLGKTTEWHTKGKLCEVNGAVTKGQECGETMYALQVTELRVPLELLATS
ncbi:hypothetical protein BGW37DRAFT_480459 [Umbelopsis sp. PMI_123]|jgi:hypothetical protein|nr:hypothetical protein BGW37DRAFT_480459 [Umbelopsis sp. PMI_123]